MLSRHPIYYATDKDRFDLMMSAKRKLTLDNLRDIALSKGILISTEDDRETVANYLSMMPHGYYDLEILLHASHSATRAEKYTSVTLEAKNISDDELSSIVKKFAQDRRDEGTNDTVFVNTKADRISLEVKYSELDYSKSALSQRQDKTAEIEVIRNGDQITIRTPASEKSREIANGISEKLSTTKNIKRNTIDLYQLISADERTAFFTDLTRNIKGLTLHDVTSVSVVRFGTETSHEIDEDLLEERDEAQAQMLTIVKKVALYGGNLLSSEEYGTLRKRGFYISKVVWLAVVTDEKPDVIEFEAGFGNEDDPRLFRYNVRGAYRYTKKGQTTQTRRPISNVERDKYMSLLELWSSKIFSSIIDNRQKGSARRKKAK